MAGTRFSRQRAAIVDALHARCDHPTAEMLYRTLRQTHPNISLGTVYRNLTLLEEQGEALRIYSKDGPDRFDGITAPHNHLQCRGCGAMVDLPTDVSLDLAKVRADAARSGMAVDHHQVVFFGLCAACRDRAQ